MDNNPKYSINRIIYRNYPLVQRQRTRGSIRPIGIDTEAYKTGQMFMLATSLGDVFHADEWPRCLFSRKYRGQSFVSYNLKYEQGAFVRHIPVAGLYCLREGDTITYQGYSYKTLGYKCLIVRRGKNCIHIYDMYTFFRGSLDYNAEKYLGKKKIDIGRKDFTSQYVKSHWDEIANYCVQDAVLVAELAELLIRKFERFGVYPRKLYSTAYISYQYFRTNCPYVTVKRYWDNDRDVIDMALKAYNGGKFEVTRRGRGYYYQYDIVSAYPAEIANLIDISHARVVRTKKYRKGATYGFLRCRIRIDDNVHSPVPWLYGNVWIYPVGIFQRVITKAEYDYLVSLGADVEIISAVWLHCDYRTRPYRRIVNRLVKEKQKYKREGAELDYHTVKIFLNSIYGKFGQLIESHNTYKASTCWNPIYYTIITANTRIRMSQLQHQYPDICAVHTDSVISTRKIEVAEQGGLGNLIYEREGDGIIVGTGIYQIGEKSKLRGFDLSYPLMELCDTNRRTIKIDDRRVYTWREVAFHDWDAELINHFDTVSKNIHVNFDTKRIWLDDARNFRELLSRQIDSLPRFAECLG